MAMISGLKSSMYLITTSHFRRSKFIFIWETKRWSVLDAKKLDEVDDESTCRQINLFKSGVGEIDVISESEICSFLTRTLS